MSKMTKKFEKWFDRVFINTVPYYMGAVIQDEIKELTLKAYQKGLREGKANNTSTVGGIRRVTKKTLHTTRIK